MNQLDLEPYEYRREDPETGEMKQPVNKKLCRVMFYVALATLLLLGFQAISAGHDVGMIVTPALIGGAAGALFILSLRRPDW